MKNILILLSVAILAIFTFSCDKEDVEDTVASLSDATMTATVNDTAWTTATRVTKLFDSPVETFVITGTSLEGKIMAITIKGTEAKTYTTSTSIDSLSAQVGAAWRANSKNYFSKNGTVQLTKVDKTNKKISGTFSFNMISTTDLEGFPVVSGTFKDLSYTASSGAPTE